MSDIYICPECKEEHTASEWTIATLVDAEGPVMPLETADDYESYVYTCPTCWEVSEINRLEQPKQVQA